MEKTESIAKPILASIVDDVPNSLKLKLFDDIDFVYEAQLAKMELASWFDRPKEFVRRAAYYEEINGEKTYHYHISNITGKGQIGRTNQYLTHWYYPYKAKFHPQMIKAVINWMGLGNGEVVLDPFCGSGTTLVEAKTIGVSAVGVDIDPVCTLISKTKTDLLDLSAKMLESIPLKEAFAYFQDIGPETSIELERYLTGEPANVIRNRGILEATDQRLYDFFLLSYLYALSDHTHIGADMWRQFEKNVLAMIANIRKFNELGHKLILNFGGVEIKHGDVKNLSKELQPESIDGIVTSPPYADVIDYVANDMHALQYLSMNPDRLRNSVIGLRGNASERLELYIQDMSEVFLQLNRVLKTGRNCVVVVGNPSRAGETLRLDEIFVKLAQKMGFTFVGRIRRPILAESSSLRYEYILAFEKTQHASDSCVP